MAGGVRIAEPAVDLAVCCAIISSLLNKIVNNQFVLIGEVGLGGEVRSVGHIEKRIQEAEKLGFKKIIIPKNNLKGITASQGIEIIGVENLVDAVKNIFK